MTQVAFQPEEHRESLTTEKQRGDEETSGRSALPATPLQDESVDTLLARYHIETIRSRRAARKAVQFGVVGLAATTLLEALCLLSVYLLGFEGLPLTVIVGVWLIYLVTLGIAAQPVLRAHQARRALRVRLARHEDVRVLGPLAEMLDTPDPTLRRLVGAALCRLLSQLTTANTPPLTLQQREDLYAVLRRPANRDEIDLQVALMRALPCFGDTTILSTVERLAESHYARPRGGLLSAEARNCLPALRVRALQERSSSTLLRPSMASAPVDQLLHPAQELPHDGERLLRADTVQ